MKAPVIIDYCVKSSRAGTDYLLIEQEAATYLYKWLKIFLADMAERMTFESGTRKLMLTRRPVDQICRGRKGNNSLLSFIGGLCHNYETNKNINISVSQQDSIEFTFAVISQYYQDQSDCLPVKFRLAAYTIPDFRDQY